MLLVTLVGNCFNSAQRVGGNSDLILLIPFARGMVPFFELIFLLPVRSVAYTKSSSIVICFGTL